MKIDIKTSFHVLHRYLAEVLYGPDDNYWIVNQLINRHSKEKLKPGTDDERSLGEPHFEDQWWIGAKSHVSFKPFDSDLDFIHLISYVLYM